MGRHDFSEVPFQNLKDAAAESMCQRICYAETQVEARYSDEQLVDKMKADIQHDLKSLQQYGLPASHAR